MATFLLVLVISDRFSNDPRFNAHSVGHDFLAFYTAGTFLREGRLNDVYDLEKVIPFQHDLTEREKLPIGERFAPFWNPPVFIWIFVPFSKLPYFDAWWRWFAINITCLIAAFVILCRMLIASRQSPPVDWKTWGLVPLLIPLSSTALQSIGHGQNTGISILLLSSIVYFWRRNRALLAGLVCGLLFYKPQLASLVAIALIATLGWRALVGLAITGTGLLALSELTLPGSTHLWLTRLPAILKYMQIDHPYAWDRHVTLESFWRLLIQGYAVGDLQPIARIAWIASEIGLLLALGWMLLRVTRSADGLRSAGESADGSSTGGLKSARRTSLDLFIAATIVSMPLLMPFFFDYDLMLLAVAVVVYACNRLQTDRTTRFDRVITATWIALYIWLFLNAFVGVRTHVNAAVLLMLALAGMLMLAGTVISGVSMADDLQLNERRNSTHPLRSV
ncbi:MAG TPA: glycosyltransferase family 87 protein [Tepidisphaeraceae bacterium]|nr:glycosyltransferase family 87 protein [Tepidisphaeraceae bacterium]